MALDISLDDGKLTIELSGKDRFFAMRSGMSVPLASVQSARILDRQGLIDELAVRIRGSSIPGRVMAGSYSVWPHARVEKGDRQFWLVYTATEVVSIDTFLPRPRRIVLQVDDPFRLVADVERLAALARSDSDEVEPDPERHQEAEPGQETG